MLGRSRELTPCTTKLRSAGLRFKKSSEEPQLGLSPQEGTFWTSQDTPSWGGEVHTMVHGAQTSLASPRKLLANPAIINLSVNLTPRGKVSKDARTYLLYKTAAKHGARPIEWKFQLIYLDAGDILAPLRLGFGPRDKDWNKGYWKGWRNARG
ncbi:hypothetical protein Baya_7805 [Bagarius yarrelli]|uniref:Uncharacterized protein n=1 Tax=Bagarius yarrelli TaxID=175774 RepID=A0A556U2K2_BAGYA|nr:hypothetical protein Baya_7805 [Bagarius yarrelli]